MRVQIHVDGDEIQVFTRRLEDLTEQFPEVVRTIRNGVTADRVILDGELVGYDSASGEPVAFRQFSRRIKRKHDVEALAAEIPARVYLFDCLSNGDPLLDHTLDARLRKLSEAFEPIGDLHRAEHVQVTVDETGTNRIRELYDAALAEHHEGLMLEDPTAVYEPGRRVGVMLKN